MFVDVDVSTNSPWIIQAIERQVVAFQVIDSCDGDSARGDWAGQHPGVVRPMLKWDTVFVPEEKASPSL
jgi:lipopolysaccharide transport system ATP-binding protein